MVFFPNTDQQLHDMALFGSVELLQLVFPQCPHIAQADLSLFNITSLPRLFTELSNIFFIEMKLSGNKISMFGRGKVVGGLSH